MELAAPALVDLIVVTPGCQTAFVNGARDSRTIVMEAAARQLVRCELPGRLPEGVALRLSASSRMDLPPRAPLQLDTGRGMGLESFFAQEVQFGGSGDASVAITVPGECRLSVSLRVGDTAYALRGTQLTFATLPTNGELVIRAPDAEWRRVLSAAKK